MKKALLFLTVLLYPFLIHAQKTITGFVLDESGEPIISVNILTTTSGRGTISELDGSFSLDVTAEDDNILISHIGYEEQNIPIDDRLVYNVKLVEYQVLAEIVITALGVKRDEKSLGYAVQTIDGSQILYESIADIKEMERLSIAEGNKNMEGVAVVLKTWMFSILTNAYGDIPYTEAARGGTDGIYSPKYDQQELIYTGEEGLLSELERATKLLEPAGGAITGDIIYNGDALKWEKLANSLKLRLLMYASNQMDVSTEIQTIINDGVIMESNEDNAVLTYLNAFPNEFPIIPLKTGDFDAVVMGSNAIDLMNSYDDPWRTVYARPDNLDFTTPEFSGAINGYENPDICSKAGSRLGLNYYNYTDHPISSNQAQGIMMMYAEVEFISAEAAAKGWIASPTANHYQKGIKASMDYYQVDYTTFGYTDFNDYYMNAGVSFTNPIQILEQKWLSLFFTELEPYFEVRRWLSEENFDWNMLPFLSPTCQNVNNDNLPVRFLYPAEEQSLNGNNYQEAVDRLGGG
jgi:hypothetical protein